MARLLVIVSRNEPSRTTYLKHVFASETVGRDPRPSCRGASAVSTP